MNNLTIKNNVLYNTCSGFTGGYSDCGAIYIAGDLQKRGSFGGFVIRWTGFALGDANAGSDWVFDIDERLRELSAKGDELERLNTLVDFELFRGDLERAVPRSDRSGGGRPAFDHVLMFKALILQIRRPCRQRRSRVWSN